MTAATPEKLLTVQAIAEILDIGEMTVYRLIESKKLPAFRVGVQYRIDPRDFADYMRSISTTAGAA